MDDEAFEYMRLAEEKSDLPFVIKGNGLKRKSEQSKVSIATWSGKLEEKRKKLIK